ncbi:MAG: helix-turn-helix domain-containing protein [Pseudomonadota bacterium]
MKDATQQQNPSRKRRLPAAQAKQRILDSAHAFFVEGGPEAVKVQAVAESLGITDAAIHYHFKDRETLLEALLAHGGRKLKMAVQDQTETDLAALLNQLSDIYDRQQFAKLAMWLIEAGWTSDDAGMFADFCKTWQQNRGVSALEAKHQIAFINLILASEALFAGAFLRSVGLADNQRDRRRFHKWIGTQLDIWLESKD